MSKKTRKVKYGKKVKLGNKSWYCYVSYTDRCEMKKQMVAEIKGVHQKIERVERLMRADTELHKARHAEWSSFVRYCKKAIKENEKKLEQLKKAK